jgi:hypothetical protein
MRALSSVMDDCGELVETTMRGCRKARRREIDRELGKVGAGDGRGRPPFVPALQRELQADWFREYLDLDGPKRSDGLAADEPKNMPSSTRSG